MNKRLIIAIIVILVIVGGAIGALLYGVKQRSVQANIQPVTLEYWGVYEDPKAIKLLTDAYHTKHPKVTIKYRSFRADEYAQKLLEGWAADLGPDVFMLPNTWLREYQKYINPMPSSMKVPARIVQGTFKKEVVDTYQTQNGYTTKDIKDNFLDVVYQDVVIDDKIYGLPLSVDTMVLYYNRSLLQNSGIPEPATTWSEIVTQAAQISRINQSEQLIQSAIALGATNNIPNAFDILSLLMMQVGVEMSNQSRATFASDQRTAEAIDFYLNFSRPDTITYSWNKDQANALDLFTAGKLAYFLGYNYHAPIIKQTNPKLDWDILPVPQAENSDQPITYANYWINVVPKKTSHSDIAWQFIKEITGKNEIKPYLDLTSKTTARLSLINEQKTNPAIAPFAELLLQAKSWYRGYDYSATQKYFLDMVDQIILEEEDKFNIINTAQNQINKTYSVSQN